MLCMISIHEDVDDEPDCSSRGCCTEEKAAKENSTKVGEAWQKTEKEMVMSYAMELYAMKQSIIV